jgi:hypothetical protein
LKTAKRAGFFVGQAANDGTRQKVLAEISAIDMFLVCSLFIVGVCRISFGRNCGTKLPDEIAVAAARSSC